MTGSRPPVPSLSDCEWLLRGETQQVFAALTAYGGEARAVGGAVRNSLLDRPVADIDIATNLPPEEVMAAAGQAGLKVVPTGIDHGTVTVIVSGHPFEVTTLREDVETFGRHAEVAFSKDWAADAARRDFTMNALYVDADGTLYDPLGGLEDLNERRVRFIGDAQMRIREDYLRILRFFRFTAEYGVGKPDAAGLSACQKERLGLHSLSAERIRAELLRLLIARRAGEIIEAMFLSGLLVDIIAAAPLLRRFEQMIAIEEAQGLAPDPIRRLGALCLFVKDGAEWLTQHLRLSRAERQQLENLTDRNSLVGPHMSEQDGRAALYRLGESGYRDRLLLAWAENGNAPTTWEEFLALPSRFEPPVFPLTGHHVKALGITDGVEIGRALKQVEAWWVGEDFRPDFAALEAKLASVAAQKAS